jgi:hypothetical protein
MPLVIGRGILTGSRPRQLSAGRKRQSISIAGLRLARILDTASLLTTNEEHGGAFIDFRSGSGDRAGAPLAGSLG